MEDQGLLQRFDSEPLFGNDVFNALVREDSLLHRTPSSAFANLIEDSPEGLGVPQPSSNAFMVLHESGLMEPADEQQFQPQQQLHLPPQQLLQLQQMQQPVSDPLAILEPPPLEDIILMNSMEGFDQNIISGLPHGGGNDAAMPVPSMQPWPGKYDFSFNIFSNAQDKGKFCYSKLLNKLYLNSNSAVPIQFYLNDWAVATKLTITPVFIKPENRSVPVKRCHNCAEKQELRAGDDIDLPKHIIQVEADDATYETHGERWCVTIPVHPPPLGESGFTLLVKSMCLTTCVGGPNRRPFCMVFTLRDRYTNIEIGRQVVETKCCKCPSRDQQTEEKNLLRNQHPMNNGSFNQLDEKCTKVRNLASGINVPNYTKSKRIKREYVEEQEEYTTLEVRVPTKIAANVNVAINSLVQCMTNVYLQGKE